MSLHHTTLIEISRIDDRGRLRTVRLDHATAMAELIAEAGQLQPIRVLETVDGYRLVFGARRLAGMIQLGRPQILATIVPASDSASDGEIELQGIVENFGQFGMTVLERAIRLAEWKDLHEALHPEVRQGGDRRKSGTSEQKANLALCFSEVAAEALDISESAIKRAIRIARNIAAEHQESLRHHSVADRQQELLLLADQTLPRQKALVDLIVGDPCHAHSVTDAIALLDNAPGRREVPIHEKFQQRFTVLKPVEQERFFELNADAIERWMAKRIDSQTARNRKVAA